MTQSAFNFETAGESNPDNVRRRILETAEQLGGRDWHIQLNAALPLVIAVKDALAAIPMPVVIDHFARTLTPAADSRRCDNCHIRPPGPPVFRRSERILRPALNLLPLPPDERQTERTIP